MQISTLAEGATARFPRARFDDLNRPVALLINCIASFINETTATHICFNFKNEFICVGIILCIHCFSFDRKMFILNYRAPLRGSKPFYYSCIIPYGIKLKGTS